MRPARARGQVSWQLTTVCRPNGGAAAAARRHVGAADEQGYGFATHWMLDDSPENGRDQGESGLPKWGRRPQDVREIRAPIGIWCRAPAASRC